MVSPSSELWQPLSGGQEDDSGMNQPDKGKEDSIPRGFGETQWGGASGGPVSPGPLPAEALDVILRLQCQALCCPWKIS